MMTQSAADSLKNLVINATGSWFTRLLLQRLESLTVHHGSPTFPIE
jgi:hypothetical protein